MAQLDQAHIAFQHDKVLTSSVCRRAIGQQQAKGRKVVLCHGVFDIVHPGHIAHLEAAAALGDILVVSITSAPHVKRGPGRPAFGDADRLRALAALQVVDHVIIAPGGTAIGIIDLVRPGVYCKGKEYAEHAADVTGQIREEVDRVEHWGGEVRYVSGVVYSSTKLVNEHLGGLRPDVRRYAGRVVEGHSIDEIVEMVRGLSRLRVTVIGDVIIDEYNRVNVQGLTAKGRCVAARFQSQEQHAGGALAIARHLTAVAGEVRMLSVMGDEPQFEELIQRHVAGSGVDLELHQIPGRKTVLKRRYVEQQGARDDFSKLFSVNILDDESLDAASHRRFLQRLERHMSDTDLVVVADYGHGLLDEAARAIVQEQAPVLALNVQTNSANFGYNLFTGYERADTFCLDEQELRLAYADRTGEPQLLLGRLAAHLSSKQGWLTLGSRGSVGLEQGREDWAPALTLHVKDTTGAGDAFFGLASLAYAGGLPLSIGSLLGNLGGAMAANVVGNAEGIDSADLLKFLSTVLKV